MALALAASHSNLYSIMARSLASLALAARDSPRKDKRFALRDSPSRFACRKNNRLDFLRGTQSTACPAPTRLKAVTAAVCYPLRGWLQLQYAIRFADGPSPRRGGWAVHRAAYIYAL